MSGRATRQAPLRGLCTLALGAAVLGLGPGCSGAARSGSGAQASEAEDHPMIGAPAPSFDLPGVPGPERVTFSGSSDKVTIVDFWATWCEPCRDSFPVYQGLVERYAGRLRVIGVSVDEDPSGISAFAKETGVSFAIGWDEDQSAAKSYNPDTMPTSFVVDQRGVIRFVHQGFRPGDDQHIQAWVGSLMN